jgi:hypothetical protein
MSVPTAYTGVAVAMRESRTNDRRDDTACSRLGEPRQRPPSQPQAKSGHHDQAIQPPARSARRVLVVDARRRPRQSSCTGARVTSCWRTTSAERRLGTRQGRLGS